MSDLITVVSQRQALVSNSHRLSSYHYTMKWLTKWASRPYTTEAVTLRSSVKKVFLKVSQNSPENTCVEVSACNFIKKEIWTQVFMNNFMNKVIENHRWLFLMLPTFVFENRRKFVWSHYFILQLVWTNSFSHEHSTFFIL